MTEETNRQDETSRTRPQHMLEAAEARWDALNAGRKMAFILLLALAFTAAVFG